MKSRISGRRSARELVLSALFQIDLAHVSPDEAVSIVSNADRYADETLCFARELVLGSSRHLSKIDSVIERHARGWSLDRMANIDRNILRLALYEVLYRTDIPPSVTVDEAVELAKKFSTAESGRFVNGVLGNVVRNLEEEQSAL